MVPFPIFWASGIVSRILVDMRKKRFHTITLMQFSFLIVFLNNTEQFQRFNSKAANLEDEANKMSEHAMFSHCSRVMPWVMHVITYILTLDFDLLPKVGHHFVHWWQESGCAGVHNDDPLLVKGQGQRSISYYMHYSGQYPGKMWKHCTFVHFVFFVLVGVSKLL